jgi:DNA-binding winged helix-turn-helix (wHTH) protein
MTLANGSISSLGRTYRRPMMFSSDGEDSNVTTGAQVIDHPAATATAFGPFRVFAVQRLLTKAGKPVQIGSRAFDILIALLERPGELVTKEELIARVWPSTYVEQANLAVQIGGLRRALGDGQQGNRYILNIPGRGYRFVAPVTIEKVLSPEAAAPRPVDRDELPSLYQAQIPTAAVVPADGNEGPEQRPQQRRVLTIVRSAGAGEAKAALALVEKFLASHGDGLWVVGVAPIEES